MMIIQQISQQIRQISRIWCIPGSGSCTRKVSTRSDRDTMAAEREASARTRSGNSGFSRAIDAGERLLRRPRFR